MALRFREWAPFVCIPPFCPLKKLCIRVLKWRWHTHVTSAFSERCNPPPQGAMCSWSKDYKCSILLTPRQKQEPSNPYYNVVHGPPHSSEHPKYGWVMDVAQVHADTSNPLVSRIQRVSGLHGNSHLSPVLCVSQKKHDNLSAIWEDFTDNMQTECSEMYIYLCVWNLLSVSKSSTVPWATQQHEEGQLS